ncbi:MAG: hypothetical protein ACRC5T_00450, partial [Cetobacterium sp.]
MNILICVMGKSGSGKNYISDKLGLPLLVSHTTREIRAGEQDGRDYHFVDRETFKKMEEYNLFAESVEYNGNKYGFSLSEINKMNESDYVAIVTPSGFEQLKELFHDNIVVPVYLESNDILRKDKLLRRHKDEILIDKYKKQIDDRMEQDRVTFSRVLNIKNLKQFGVDYTEDTARRIADSIKEYIDCLHG